MAVSFQDTLLANVVFVRAGLLMRPEEQRAFARHVATDVRVEGLLTGSVTIGNVPQPAVQEVGTTQGYLLIIPRDRITIECQPERTIISREYPTFGDLDLVAQMAENAIQFTDLGGSRPTAYGFNMELVYGQDSGDPSDLYLAKRLYPHESLGSDWEISGGTGNLVFLSPEGTWTVHAERRANDPDNNRVFLRLNLHVNQSEFPGRDEVSASLKKIWEQARDFAQRLDKSVQ